jgi:hypothetical protein
VICLLLDENVSPALVDKLGGHDVCAQAVPHIGLSGRIMRSGTMLSTTTLASL